MSDNMNEDEIDIPQIILSKDDLINLEKFLEEIKEDSLGKDRML